MIEFFKNKFAGKIDFNKKYLHESLIITTSVANTICWKLTKKSDRENDRESSKENDIRNGRAVSKYNLDEINEERTIYISSALSL